MTPEKRKKIKALLDSPASTPNEKEICRKLLKDNPEESRWRPVAASEVRDKIRRAWEPPRNPNTGTSWEDYIKREQYRQDEFRIRRDEAEGQARRQQEAARRQAEPALEQQRQDLWDVLFGGQIEVGGLGFGSGPLGSFYEELERLRKERDK